MNRLISMYSPDYPRQLTYMLQMTTYEPGEFLRWWLRAKDFRKVNVRRDLVRTRRSLAVLALAFGLTIGVLTVSALLLFYSIRHEDADLLTAGILVFATYPFTVPALLVLAVWIGKILIIAPRQKKLIAASAPSFRNHPGTVIAVAGSYGKTTMKEVLHTVLKEGGKVAATPGNKNVAISHADFARSFDGDEKFLIVEFGEGYKGDVARFTRTVNPDIGIVTGVAPNHLDKYGTLDALRSDFMSLMAHAKRAYAAEGALRNVEDKYGQAGALGWKVSGVKNDLEGLRFMMRKDKSTLHIKSGLVGEHLIGTLAFAAALAAQLGLTKEQIEKGMAKTKPFEHRMQPRHLHGAWIIDDTYNGNLEGMRAGLKFLAGLKTKGKKTYVTPGLVDQAGETRTAHEEIGRLITEANPDETVLMKNSAARMIIASLEANGYKGKVTVIDEPLTYYQNLELTLAGGDIVLMQNDWTDNYA